MYTGKTLRTYSTYSMAGCIEECEDQQIAEVCGCRLPGHKGRIVIKCVSTFRKIDQQISANPVHMEKTVQIKLQNKIISSSFIARPGRLFFLQLKNICKNKGIKYPKTETKAPFKRS